MKSWLAEQGEQSPTTHHEQEEADGEAKPFPQPLFHGKQWHTGGQAVPARSWHFILHLCPALCHHSLLLPCLSLEAAAWPSTRGSLKRISHVPLLSAGICSLIGCLWRAPQLRAASTFLISKRLMLSNCLISPQHLLPFISGSLLQFIDGAVFSLSLFHRGCISKCFHCRQRYLLLIDAYYSF